MSCRRPRSARSCNRSSRSSRIWPSRLRCRRLKPSDPSSCGLPAPRARAGGSRSSRSLELLRREHRGHLLADGRDVFAGLVRGTTRSAAAAPPAEAVAGRPWPPSPCLVAIGYLLQLPLLLFGQPQLLLHRRHGQAQKPGTASCGAPRWPPAGAGELRRLGAIGRGQRPETDASTAINAGTQPAIAHRHQIAERKNRHVHAGENLVHRQSHSGHDSGTSKTAWI